MCQLLVNHGHRAMAYQQAVWIWQTVNKETRYVYSKHKLHELQKLESKNIFTQEFVSKMVVEIAFYALQYMEVSSVQMYVLP